MKLNRNMFFKYFRYIVFKQFTIFTIFTSPEIEIEVPSLTTIGGTYKDLDA